MNTINTGTTLISTDGKHTVEIIKITPKTAYVLFNGIKINMLLAVLANPDFYTVKGA